MSHLSKLIAQINEELSEAVIEAKEEELKSTTITIQIGKLEATVYISDDDFVEVLIGNNRYPTIEAYIASKLIEWNSVMTEEEKAYQRASYEADMVIKAMMGE
jgi:hypothetical protein